MNIYLAGPIFGKSDDQCKAWRNASRQLIEAAGHLAVDPMDRDYRMKEDCFIDEIVVLDKRDIDSCDALLVNANNPSWGTAMEVMYGYFQGKVICCFCGGDSISPWLSFHSSAIFHSAPDAVRWLTGTR